MKNWALIAAVFCSCHGSGNNSRAQLATPSDTLKKTVSINQKANEPNKDAWGESEYEGSIQFGVMLRDLLKIARQNKWKNSFSKELSWDYPNALCSGSLSFGYLFSENEKHLITKRNIAGAEMSIDIFLFQGNKFTHLLSEDLDMLGYLGDTIMNVNGDCYKDFLFHWYSSSGCCRREAYAVYLYDSKKHVFSRKFEFMNPTFSSKEKTIRGVEYGHPGEAPLYKYKWNGMKVDAVEFIYRDTAKGKFYLSKVEDYDTALKKGKLLRSLPKEYRNIQSIDWFLLY